MRNNAARDASLWLFDDCHQVATAFAWNRMVIYISSYYIFYDMYTVKGQDVGKAVDKQAE